MNPLDLLDLCEHVYYSPGFTAGPDAIYGGTVATIDRRTVLAFRGTLVPDGTLSGDVRSELNWLDDLLAGLVVRPEYPGRVHHGFALALDALWPAVSRYDLPDDVIITGHSLGGALALLAGSRLQHLNPEVVTFAAPKVGDRSFAAAFRVRATCYENPHDIVPRLPPFGYQEVGDLVSPGPDWLPPHGVRANHVLESGYEPWLTKMFPKSPPTPPAVSAKRAA